MIKKYILQFLVFFSFLLALTQCTNKEEVLGEGVYFCDAEKTSINGNKFVSYGGEFEGGKSRSSEEAFEGEFSCLLDSQNLYGMTYEFTDLKPGEVFEVSVYRKSKNNKGKIVAQSVGGTCYQAESISFNKKDENGWDVLALTIQLPQNIDSLKGLKVYTYYGAKEGGKAYFDNLKIRRYIRNPSGVLPVQNEFNIEITDYDYATLKDYRDRAISQATISKDLKKEIKGFLKYQGKTYRIGIRLKGDWTDHLEGDKWSYRITVKDGKSIMGMKVFSIQNPRIRDYLQEWVFHKACDSEGLLTTRFDYVPVAINGVKFGLYNIEEHFAKQLVESRSRREGVLLKFDEEGFWENNLFYMEHGKYPSTPFFEASTILPFNKKKVSKSETLYGQFLIAQNLMLKYKQGSNDLDSYMDLESLAKAYALMDLGNIDHAYTWHNQRFYYNPVTSKLEFIIYDCYSKPGDALLRKDPIKGNVETGKHFSAPKDYCLNSVFDDALFQRDYLKWLKTFSNEDYVQRLLSTLEPQIDSLTQLIKEEDAFYDYDYQFLAENAKRIRGALSEYEEKVNSKTIAYELAKETEKKADLEYPFKSISLKAHVESLNSEGSVLLSLQNYHDKPIVVVGYGLKQFPDSIMHLPKKVTLEEYSRERRAYNLTLKKKPKKLYYTTLVAGAEATYSSKLIPWPRPQNKSLHTENSFLDANPRVYRLTEDSLIFKKGKHVLKKGIVVPKGLVVVFEPGTELVLNNNTYFMSYSAVNMIGSQSSPIKISSTDGTGNGFSVLQAKKESKLEYVVFDGLNTFSNQGWLLTGAITFYESSVDIDNCTFTNNHCEDGLNIIRSTFKLANSEISNTFSDGLDADFCEGEVVNSNFKNTGNDALDFSGSTIEIKNTQISSVGDKGVSCGEESTVTIQNCSIETAIIGVAAKDNSKVEIKEIGLKSCETGFTAFQKKQEYGPGNISVQGYKVDSVNLLLEAEKGSAINLKD